MVAIFDWILLFSFKLYKNECKGGFDDDFDLWNGRFNMMAIVD